MSRRHRVIALLMFLQFNFVFALLMIGSLFQVQEIQSVKMALGFQTPTIVTVFFKIVFYFFRFEKMKEFWRKIRRLFNETKSGKDVLESNLKTCKKVAGIRFGFYTTTIVLGAISALKKKKPVMVLWKPPFEIGHDLNFYPHWIEESIGNLYSTMITSAMDMYPICLIIMLRGYLSFLEREFRNAKNKKDFVECIKLHVNITAAIREFQEIFSPVLFIHALAMTLVFGATLLISVSTVSFN